MVEQFSQSHIPLTLKTLALQPLFQQIILDIQDILQLCLQKALTKSQLRVKLQLGLLQQPNHQAMFLLRQFHQIYQYVVFCLSSRKTCIQVTLEKNKVKRRPLHQHPQRIDKSMIASSLLRRLDQLVLCLLLQLTHFQILVLYGSRLSHHFCQ